MGGANQRLKKELEGLQKHPLSFCTITPNDDDLLSWTANIQGPSESPYKDGVFKLSIEIPTGYPFVPPDVKFLTQIYHPNVNEHGVICLDVLKDNWTSEMTITSILISIWVLMGDPNPESPLVVAIGQQYKEDQPAYLKTATEWTKRYATPP